MKTDFPTVDLYFCFAFTFCKVRVYKNEEQFARRLLGMSPGVAMLNASDSESWQEIDPPILMALVCRSLSRAPRRLTQLRKIAQSMHAA